MELPLLVDAYEIEVSKTETGEWETCGYAWEDNEDLQRRFQELCNDPQFKLVKIVRVTMTSAAASHTSLRSRQVPRNIVSREIRKLVRCKCCAVQHG